MYINSTHTCTKKYYLLQLPNKVHSKSMFNCLSPVVSLSGVPRSSDPEERFPLHSVLQLPSAQQDVDDGVNGMFTVFLEQKETAHSPQFWVRCEVLGTPIYMCGLTIAGASI